MIEPEQTGNEETRQDKTAKIITGIAILAWYSLCLIAITALVFLMVYPLIFQMPQAREIQRVVLPNCPPPPEDWKIIFSDDFDNRNTTRENGWRLDKQIYSNVSTTWASSGTKFKFNGTKSEGFSATNFPSTADIEDFYASVIVHRDESSELGGGGLSFRQNQAEYYTFSVNDALKNYQAAALLDGSWQTIFFPTSISVIEQSSKNTLTVFAKGAEFVLCINNRQVNTFTDDILTKGRVGLFVEAEKSEKEVNFFFDDFIIYAP